MSAIYETAVQPARGATARDAHLIASDAEAIDAARALAARLAEGAAERDRERRLPYEEIDWFSQSGLWAITVPKAYGGAGVSHVTLTEVVKAARAKRLRIACRVRTRLRNQVFS